MSAFSASSLWVKPFSFRSVLMFSAKHAVMESVIIEDYDGDLPCDFESLMALPGIGPKCASLVLGISCGQPHIGVDVHVHRVTNRWGYVQICTGLRPKSSQCPVLEYCRQVGVKNPR